MRFAPTLAAFALIATSALAQQSGGMQGMNHGQMSGMNHDDMAGMDMSGMDHDASTKGKPAAASTDPKDVAMMPGMLTPRQLAAASAGYAS